MKVLHFPVNISSQASISVRALRDIGVEARCLAKGGHLLEDIADVETIPDPTASHYSPMRIFQKLQRCKFVFEAIKWADVIHWHFKTGALGMDLDFRYAAFLDKPRIVEFWGSDIRIPEIACIDNPYITQMYKDYPELIRGGAEGSIRTQRKFARYGFECLIPDYDMGTYIQKDIWPTTYKSIQRLYLKDFPPVFPDPNKKCPVVVHPPSKKAVKGTEAILKAVENLKKTLQFEFVLIHGLPHAKAIEMMRTADIVIDEINIGSHGVVSVEGMALGKPVLCYIKPSFLQGYPPDFPIINASHDNIEQVLGDLIQNGEKRYTIGCQSRAYVEKHHDAHKVARDLVKIYEELIEKKSKKHSSR